MSRLKSAVLLAVLALGACRHLPEIADDGLSFETRRQGLEAVTSWEMRGRIAAETPDDGWQGRFFWTQDAGALNLLIRGPLGAGSIEISGTDEHLTVRRGGETWRLVDPEIELSELLGWWVPITSLDAWLKGVPDPDFAARRVIDDERIRRLEQRAWTLRYERYALIDGRLLPRRIRMTYETLELSVTVDDFISRPDGGAD